ncbi:MAG: BMP family ABC transporter substrate-binding protein [Oscillospiraceae bacterium]|nr:BMP family ABC transporter substrate-binding protein [Oscillospiraceae bacterium]
MRSEAVEQYNIALKLGQKYMKNAILRGEYPYPLVLDDILQESAIAGYADLGTVNVPTERFVGTKSAGRVAALAGNFMPLLEVGSEFAAKWIALCDAHLSEEGIRDPIQCYEFLGRFYVQEGNKRLSVLKSYLAPSISARVTRVIPQWSEDHDVQLYYEFMHFYSLSGLYGIDFRHRGDYAKLQAALGFEPEHIWTENERRSFSAGFSHLKDALKKHDLEKNRVTPAEVLLTWLQVFSFGDIKDLTQTELARRIDTLWPDVLARDGGAVIELSTEPNEKEKNVISKIISIAKPDHLNIAFLYDAAPEDSTWVRAHDDGRQYLEDQLGARVAVRAYLREERDYDDVLEAAIDDGAELIFATDAAMVSACRKAAALHKNVRFLTCALFQPYTGVRMYNGRTYECKFITGAIAGIMTETDTIGYVANNPIFGTPASVNAFALGARMTNPRARIKLDWACLPGDPVQRLLDSGVSVISNREIVSPSTLWKDFELGTFKLQSDGSLLPLATPYWNWGKLYEKIVRSVFTGAWNSISSSKAINYWWGMASGVLDVHISELLPDGVRGLGKILKDGICSGTIQPFRIPITDQNGVLHNDGAHPFLPDEIISMDWFCDNVDGRIPDYEELRPEYAETMRILGLYRKKLLPEAEGGQL